jgi:hypothetical protein
LPPLGIAATLSAVKGFRILLATVCAGTAVWAFAGVASPQAAGLAAPAHPSAAAKQYCKAAVKKARKAAVQRYKKQMAAQRKAYFRRTRSPKLRAAFVRKQNAQLKALERILKLCK